jgi:hypothetical protein
MSAGKGVESEAEHNNDTCKLSFDKIFTIIDDDLAAHFAPET